MNFTLKFTYPKFQQLIESTCFLLLGLAMHLCYFDENKHSADNPHFIIGGLMIPDTKALDFEKTLSQIAFNFFGSRTLTVQNEFHGKDLFHGKGYSKGRSLEDRVKLFEAVATFVINNQIPVRMVCINVERHMAKYLYPTPPYRLGLMLILERFCEHLDEINDLGLVFGDHEEGEVGKGVVDFSEYKSDGKTPMYFGRPLGRLLDTVYFTHSHHSRFLQVADLLVYMAGRYENWGNMPDKWHEQSVKAAWEKIKASGNVVIQRWP